MGFRPGHRRQVAHALSSSTTKNQGMASAPGSVLGNPAYVVGAVKWQREVLYFDVATGAWNGHHPTLSDRSHGGAYFTSG
jgi:hypothetical protein